MRYEHEGKIAVLYSPGYGAGWSSWNQDHAEILMMHPVLVEPVHQFEQGLITKEQMKEKIVFGLAMLGLDDLYNTNGSINLTICWLDPGQRFLIKEYDGSESVVLFEQQEWLTA